MSNISRRSFVGAVAAIPFSVWFEKYGAAQAVKTRFSAYSSQGIAMLGIYQSAVARMMNNAQIPKGDPTSWVFQWYTHAVPNPPGKASEINSIYPGASPFKPMAQAVWNTCQAHFIAANEPWFLPWHRMFVYFFERIIRKASNNPSFTLPYWNYSAAGVNHGRIPPQFRVTNSSLFIQKRNVQGGGFANVNAGQPIDQFAPGVLNTSSLAQCTYLPVGQATQGFNMNLDQGLHGNVHVFVGNGQNMGSVPTAAGDPVFWMHHCNIDRLWESWNNGGRQNPTNDATWMNKTFQFVDENKQLVSVAVKDFLNIACLGYKYDALDSLPFVAFDPCAQLVVSAAAERVHATGAAISLSSGEPAKATLTPSGAAAESLAARVKKIRPGRHLYLVVKDLKADVQPGAVYNLYLDMPANTPSARRRAYYVGMIHFFDAVAHDGHDTGGASDDSGKFYSFDVTKVAKSLAASGKLSASPILTIIPSGKPAADANAVVGDIKLIEK